VNAAITGKSINFVSGGATIAVDSQPLLDAIATNLKNCAGTTVEVQGHTDVTGGDAANMRLSEARASSVVQALVEKGVPTDRLLPKGYGETAPLDTAFNAAAHAKNRRIDFKVASAAAAPAVGQ
jgi:outer membrane protein OmpA-like peptidoglycan-associated protein